MPNGPGGLDAQGVWQYGEADSRALASDLFNIGQASISTRFAAVVASIPVDSGTIPLPMINGWTNYGGDRIPATYRRFGKHVTLVGVVKGTASTAGGIVGTLPAGFRPSAVIIFPVWSNAGASSGELHPDGTLRQPASGWATPWTSFALTFFAV